MQTRSLKIISTLLLGFLITLLSLLILLILYILAALSLSQWRINAPTTEHPDNITIYIIRNGAHSDIVMPMSHPQWQWANWVSTRDTKQPEQEANWVSIGWGYRLFYLETPTWADLKTSTAIKALFGKGSAALHVTFQAAAPNERTTHTAKLQLSPQQYRQLAHSISQYFVRQNNRSIPIANVHYNEHDAFYEANGRYTAFMTCNTWTNQQLKNSNAPAVMWTPFAPPLLQALQHRN